MVTGREYDHRLGRWLNVFGFTAEPFALFEAENEGDKLPSFFVDRPYLDRVLGDSLHPQAFFLLAGRGAGKTATREMVIYECLHARFRRKVLPVRYDDFAPLLSLVHNDVTCLTAQHHIQVIVRATLKALADLVPAVFFDLLDEDERALLLGYAQAFADPKSERVLHKTVSGTPDELRWETFSPRELIEALVDLVVRLGQSPESAYQAIYVLIDRVDETRLGPGAATAILEPLVAGGPVLEMRHFALKFFLPVEVGDHLCSMPAFRQDRVMVDTISWDIKALEKMVQERLSYYSGTRTRHFEDMCDEKVKASAVARLIQASQNCPRTLLQLCHAVIRRHVERTSELRLSREDVIGAVADFEQQQEIQRVGARRAPDVPLVLEETVSPPLNDLHLDAHGRVWVDGEILDPPLSNLEMRLFRSLYWKAPEVVPNKTLIAVLWPGLHQTQDEQNLRKLIDRLRGHLEGKSVGRHSRFVKNVRGRGYWLKIQPLDTPPCAAP